MTATTVVGVHGGCPSWFRASCHSAGQGGRNSYRRVGQSLLRGLASEVPYDSDWDEWYGALDDLDTTLAKGDADAALVWFDVHLPRLMTLVPARRRDVFISGVVEQYGETGLER